MTDNINKYTSQEWNNHYKSKYRLDGKKIFLKCISFIRKIKKNRTYPRNGWDGPFYLGILDSIHYILDGPLEPDLPPLIPEFYKVYTCLDDAIKDAEKLGPKICCGISMIKHNNFRLAPCTITGRFQNNLGSMTPYEDICDSGEEHPDIDTIVFNYCTSWRYTGVPVREHIRRVPGTKPKEYPPDSLEAKEIELENLKEKAEESTFELGILKNELEQISQNLSAIQKLYTEKLEQNDLALETSKRYDTDFKELEKVVKQMRIDRKREEIAERRKQIMTAMEAQLSALTIEESILDIEV